MHDPLRTTLRQLRLSGLAASLEVRLQEAQANRLSHMEFLELILQDELAVRDHRKLERRTKLACIRDLLIIDDMGMKQLPKRSGEYLFEIIMRRHETRSTIMTRNRPLEDWGKLLGEVPGASAILDRFLQHAEIVTFQGRSHRLKNRQAPEDPKPADPKTGHPTPPKPASAPTGKERGIRPTKDRTTDNDRKS